MALINSNNVDCFYGSGITSTNGVTALSDASETTWNYITPANAVYSGSQVGVYSVAPALSGSNNITVTVASGFNGVANGNADPRLGGWLLVPLIVNGVHLSTNTTSVATRPWQGQFQVERVVDPTVNNSNLSILCGWFVSADNAASISLSGSIAYGSGGFNFLGLAGANPTSYVQLRVGASNVPVAGAATVAARGGPRLDVLNSGFFNRQDGVFINSNNSHNSNVLYNIQGALSTTGSLYAFAAVSSAGALPANTAVTFRARWRAVAWPEVQ